MKNYFKIDYFLFTIITFIILHVLSIKSFSQNCVADAGINKFICLGDTIVIGGNPTANGFNSNLVYQWQPKDGLNNPNIANPLANPINTTTYLVTITDGICTDTSSVTIVVNNNPKPVAHAISPVCKDATLFLSASTGVSWNWSGPNGFSSMAQNPVITSVTYAAAGLYSVTVTNVQGCKGSDSVLVAVNPNAVATSNSPICSGEDLNLYIDNGKAWQWSGPNGFTSNIQNPVISNPTPNMSGDYSVTISDMQGCLGEFKVTVDVYSSPKPKVSSNSPLCVDDTLWLTVNEGEQWEWSGPNGFTSSLQNPVISNISTTAAGIYSVIVTNADGCSSTVSTNIEIYPNPIPNIQSNSPLCYGNTLNLSVDSGTSWLWSGPNGFSSTSQHPSISSVTSSHNGTYSVIATNGYSCTSVAFVDISVNSALLPQLTSNSPVCEGESLNLSVDIGNSWQWSGPNGFTSNLQNPSIPNVSSLISGAYSVTISDAQSCSGVGTINVLVNPSPHTILLSNSPICEGETLNLSVDVGVLWTWSGPNGFTSSLQNPVIPNISEKEAGIYSVIVTNADGCSSTVSANIEIYSNPTPNIQSNSPLCDGSTLNLSVDGGTSWVWSGPNGFSSTSQHPSISSVTLSNNGTYSVIATNQWKCTNTASIDIFVSLNPEPIATSNSPICEGYDVLLSVNTGVSWQWSGPNAYTSSLQNPVLDNSFSSQSGTYNVSVTNEYGCTGTSTIDVLIYEVPQITILANPLSVCYGESISLSASGGVSYVWNTGNTESSFVHTPQKTTIYAVTATDNQSCVGTAEIEIIVFPSPVVEILTSDSVICDGNSTTLVASSTTSASNYEWNNNHTTNTITVSPDETTFYSVEVIDINGCSADASINIVVKPIPYVDFKADSLFACTPLNVQFSSLSSPDLLHYWSFGDGKYATIINPEHLYVDEGKFDITLTVTSSEGCANSETKMEYIETYPQAVASFFTSSDTYELYESDIKFINLSTNAYSSEWHVEPYNYVSQDEHLVYTFNQVGKSTITLYVKSHNGCADSISKDIYINPLSTFYMPTSFTPNGDGLNDYFGAYAEGVDVYDYEMLIYDRWGKLIYRTYDLDEKWDGTIMQTGEAAVEGTYIWVVLMKESHDFEGKMLKQVGNVTLFR